MSGPDSQKVAAHINSLAPGLRETVELLRSIFLDSDSGISEHIKWNSVSFYYSGLMKAFDAKEYKRDLAVINLHRGRILIVFPTGSKINGLSGKDYPDGRKIVEIQNFEDAQNKAETLTNGIKEWLSQIEK